MKNSDCTCKHTGVGEMLLAPYFRFQAVAFSPGSLTECAELCVSSLLPFQWVLSLGTNIQPVLELIASSPQCLSSKGCRSLLAVSSWDKSTF